MSNMDVDLAVLVGGSRKSTTGSIQEKSAPFFFVKTINEQAREITALASNAAVDREGDIILPSAFAKYLPRYLANPVIVAAHSSRLADGSSPVIGSAAKCWLDKAGLWVTIRFADTALGEEYWTLYRDKHQRALSVGFVGHVYEYREVEGQQRRVFTVVELLEISAVPVPANPEALSRSAQRRADFVAGKRAARARVVEYGDDNWLKLFDEYEASEEGEAFMGEQAALYAATDEELEASTGKGHEGLSFDEWLKQKGITVSIGGQSAADLRRDAIEAAQASVDYAGLVKAAGMGGNESDYAALCDGSRSAAVRRFSRGRVRVWRITGGARSRL